MRASRLKQAFNFLNNLTVKHCDKIEKLGTVSVKNRNIQKTKRQRAQILNTDSRVDIYGNGSSGAKETFSVSRDSRWPPCDKNTIVKCT